MRYRVFVHLRQDAGLIASGEVVPVHHPLKIMQIRVTHVDWGWNVVLTRCCISNLLH